MAMSDSTTNEDRTTPTEKDATTTKMTNEEKCSKSHTHKSAAEHEGPIPEQTTQHQTNTKAMIDDIAPTSNGLAHSDAEPDKKHTVQATMEQDHDDAIDKTPLEVDSDDDAGSSSDGPSNQGELDDFIAANGSRLQHVLNQFKTNDSPFHAVNELTDVQPYTVEWRPTPSIAVKQELVAADFTLPSQQSSTFSEHIGRSNNQTPSPVADAASNELHCREGSAAFSARGEDVDANYRVEERDDVANSVGSSQSKTKLSLLEKTVGKLKTSIDSGIPVTTSSAADIAAIHSVSAGGSASHTVSLASSAPPNYLQELMFRSQINRRKVRPVLQSSFVPRRCPPPMYRNRRGRPIRCAVEQHAFPISPHNAPIFASSGPNNPTGVAPNAVTSLDLSSGPAVSISTNASYSNKDSYFINRQPLRKILPKPDKLPLAEPLSLQIDLSSPRGAQMERPTNFQRENGLPLVSPVSRPVKSSPCVSPNLLIDETCSSSSGSRCTSPSPNSQVQPLDLCVKSSVSPKAELLPKPQTTPPPTTPINDDLPLNLSTKKRSMSDSDDSPPMRNKRSLPLSLPPVASSNGLPIFWKTPPRGDFLAYHKAVNAESSSPLEGDTPSSGPAANSPGLDNQRLPYNMLMSPQMGFNLPGMLPVGQLSPTNQLMPEIFPEGAILLPGGSPHYRLSPRMALQHNEPPTPERPYMCEECGATFKRNKSLKQHLRVHRSQEHPFRCGLCDKMFTTSNLLKLHDQNHHQHHGTKLYQCEICPRRFANPEKLKRHSRIHTGEKPYICETEQCSKRFTDSSQLKLHMRTHSNHKPFPCPYCPLRFKYSGDVKRHVRIHTGEKPYVCGYCKMRFTQSNTLKQHERTHTGERPYHCHKCGMTFTQSGSLKYHLAHRHPPDVTYIISSSSSAMPVAPNIGMQVNNVMCVDSK